eukprot:8912182-Pyramimonas_sp.AAC.1
MCFQVLAVAGASEWGGSWPWLGATRAADQDGAQDWARVPILSGSRRWSDPRPVCVAKRRGRCWGSASGLSACWS